VCATYLRLGPDVNCTCKNQPLLERHTAGGLVLLIFLDSLAFLECVKYMPLVPVKPTINLVCKLILDTV